MHATAMELGRRFFSAYVPQDGGRRVIDYGSQNVNGSLREVCPAGNEYIGVDMAAAEGVDLVLSDPYRLPFESGSVDAVVSSSCFEHMEMFWLGFIEVLRVLRPRGVFYLNVPMKGPYHRHPVDCWRFYPDSGAALVRWGQRQGFDPALLESFVGPEDVDGWIDYVGVFLKDRQFVPIFTERVVRQDELSF